MANDRFLIQRYAGGNWPTLRGEKPFISTGPKFYEWAIKGSLVKYLEHKFVPGLKRDIDEGLLGLEESLARECAAVLLLTEGIVQALWVSHSRVPVEDRWTQSVLQVASEIPAGPVGEGVIELLSGMSGPEHYRSYVSEDAIDLETTGIPVEC
jgi:hypothetical protein